MLTNQYNRPEMGKTRNGAYWLGSSKQLPLLADLFGPFQPLFLFRANSSSRTWQRGRSRVGGHGALPNLDKDTGKRQCPAACIN